MLTSLILRNIATVSDTSLELGPGLNVLTGETGSGKSILIEGLLLALGERADRNLVRPGSKLASVEAVFTLPGEDEVLVRREIHGAGRSRMFLNDELVTLEEAREVVSSFVDLHTQRSTPALLRRKRQTESLDLYSGCEGLAGELSALYNAYGEALARRDHLEAGLRDSAGQRDLYGHEMELIDRLDPSAADYEELRGERKRLERLEHESKTLSQIQDGLDGDAGVTDVLQALEAEARKGLGEGSEELLELLSQAGISLREAAGICSGRLSGIESAPWRLEEIDGRLDEYSRLLSRCGGDMGSLLGRKEFLSGELRRIAAMEDELEELTGALPGMAGRLLELSERLTSVRTEGAGRLREAVTAELRLLGIPSAAFEVSMPPPSGDRSREISGVRICSEGAEVPEFLFSANPGQPPARLSSVASGGEMSRVSLALKLALASSGEAGTMVFDEIDAGIGGETAHALADSLQRAATSGFQVVVITHLAVVASRASTHLAVTKRTDSGRSCTEVRSLAGAARVDELTRILGGGEAARQHAAELLSGAEH